jgi:hypothetical protein
MGSIVRSRRDAIDVPASAFFACAFPRPDGASSAEDEKSLAWLTDQKTFSTSRYQLSTVSSADDGLDDAKARRRGRPADEKSAGSRGERVVGALRGGFTDERTSRFVTAAASPGPDLRHGPGSARACPSTVTDGRWSVAGRAGAGTRWPTVRGRKDHPDDL